MADKTNLVTVSVKNFTDDAWVWLEKYSNVAFEKGEYYEVIVSLGGSESYQVIVENCEQSHSRQVAIVALQTYLTTTDKK